MLPRPCRLTLLERLLAELAALERTEEELLTLLLRVPVLPVEALELERTEPEELTLELLRTLEEPLVLLLREALLEVVPEERTLELELPLVPLLRVLELEELTEPELRVDELLELLRVLCWAEVALLRVEEDVALDLVLEEEELPEDRTLEEDEPEPEDRLLLWLLRVEEELEEERVVCAIPSDAISERASTKAVVIVTNLFIASQFLRLTV